MQAYLVGLAKYRHTLAAVPLKKAQPTVLVEACSDEALSVGPHLPAPPKFVG